MAEEASAYLKSSTSDVETGKVLLGAGKFADALFYCALASEKAAAALVLHYGAKPSRRHRNSAILYRIAPPDVKSDPRFLQMVESLKKIEPLIVEARYPTRMEGMFVLPSDRFTEKDAIVGCETATSTIEFVRQILGGTL